MATAKPTTNRTQLEGALESAGFTFPFDITHLLDDALKNGGTDTQAQFSYFYSKLTHAPQFRNYYTGIFRPDGTLRMTPAQWQSYYDTARAEASKSGFALSKSAIGTMITNDVSATELKFRIQAASDIRANKDLFKSIQDVTGWKFKNAQDAFNWLTGRAPKAVYDSYEAASFEAAAKSAGVDISAQRARTIAGQAPSVSGAAFGDIEKAYQDIATKLRTSGAELSAFGLSQSDLETIEFGGAHRASLAMRADQAIKQAQAATGEHEATAEIKVTQTGRPIEPGPGQATQ